MPHSDQRNQTSPPSSAGICSTCGVYAERRYGGEGKFPPECRDCWLTGWANENAVAAAIEEARYAE